MQKHAFTRESSRLIMYHIITFHNNAVRYMYSLELRLRPDIPRLNIEFILKILKTADHTCETSVFHLAFVALNTVAYD